MSSFLLVNSGKAWKNIYQVSMESYDDHDLLADLHAMFDWFICEPQGIHCRDPQRRNRKNAATTAFIKIFCDVVEAALTRRDVAGLTSSPESTYLDQYFKTLSFI